MKGGKLPKILGSVPGIRGMIQDNFENAHLLAKSTLEMPLADRDAQRLNAVLLALKPLFQEEFAPLIEAIGKLTGFEPKFDDVYDFLLVVPYKVQNDPEKGEIARKALEEIRKALE